MSSRFTLDEMREKNDCFDERVGLRNGFLFLFDREVIGVSDWIEGIF